MTVAEIMSIEVTCCRPETTLAEAARLMQDHDCGSLPVVQGEGRELVGIITDRDIVCRAIAHHRSLDEPVSEFMSTQLTTVHAAQSAEECEELMQDLALRRIPVVDQNGCCCGMVSLADVARVRDDHSIAMVTRGVSRPYLA